MMSSSLSTAPPPPQVSTSSLWAKVNPACRRHGREAPKLVKALKGDNMMHVGGAPISQNVISVYCSQVIAQLIPAGIWLSLCRAINGYYSSKFARSRMLEVNTSGWGSIQMGFVWKLTRSQETGSAGRPVSVSTRYRLLNQFPETNHWVE